MWQYKSVNVNANVKERVSQNSIGCGSDMVADINDSDNKYSERTWPGLSNITMQNYYV